MNKLPNDINQDPIIELYKKDVDHTLIREHLKISITDRFMCLMELQRFAEELQGKGIEVKRAAGRPKDLEVIAEFEVIREESALNQENTPNQER